MDRQAPSNVLCLILAGFARAKTVNLIPYSSENYRGKDLPGGKSYGILLVKENTLEGKPCASKLL
jgi:hypothetical protein